MHKKQRFIIFNLSKLSLGDCDMSSTDTEKSNTASCHHQGKHRSHWTPINIAAMVLGFICFWPLGLFMVFWIVSGRHVQELPPILRDLWLKIKGAGNCFSADADSDNIVFNEYQNTQYDRIREIKDEIKERSNRFKAFREEAKRKADEEEFNRFMASTPLRNDV